MKLKIFPVNQMCRCDGLIDQNRYIGETPVGHACFNKAVSMTDFGHLLCHSCEELLSTGRITLRAARYREAEYTPVMTEPKFLF
jgi:hypothetical protein